MGGFGLISLGVLINDYLFVCGVLICLPLLFVLLVVVLT